MQEQVSAKEALAEANNGLGFAWAESTEDRSHFWKARHDAF
ncbi:hypothetical protein [Acetobacter orientalis]|nr:hypothetical protein [Acetobacter orientalis]